MHRLFYTGGSGVPTFSECAGIDPAEHDGIDSNIFYSVATPPTIIRFSVPRASRTAENDPRTSLNYLFYSPFFWVVSSERCFYLMLILTIAAADSPFSGEESET